MAVIQYRDRWCTTVARVDAVCPTPLAAIGGKFLAYRACGIGGAPVGREITLIGCSTKVNIGQEKKENGTLTQ